MKIGDKVKVLRKGTLCGPSRVHCDCYIGDVGKIVRMRTAGDGTGNGKGIWVFPFNNAARSGCSGFAESDLEVVGGNVWRGKCKT